MKLFLLAILIIFLSSCIVRKELSGPELAAKYVKKYTVTNVIPYKGGYWVYLKQSYKRYKTFTMCLGDSLLPGKTLTLTTLTLISD